MISRFKEKRAHTRIPYWRMVDVSNTNIKPETQFLASENLAEGGVLLETSKAFESQSACLLKLEAPFKSETVILMGIVLRSKPSQRGRFFETAVMFEFQDNNQREVLRRLIDYYFE